MHSSTAAKTIIKLAEEIPQPPWEVQGRHAGYQHNVYAIRIGPHGGKYNVRGICNGNRSGDDHKLMDFIAACGNHAVAISQRMLALELALARCQQQRREALFTCHLIDDRSEKDAFYDRELSQFLGDLNNGVPTESKDHSRHQDQVQKEG